MWRLETAGIMVVDADYQACQAQGLVNLDKRSRNVFQLPEACRMFVFLRGRRVLAEYRQLVLAQRQHRKFNLENTGQSLIRHQLSQYRVK